MGEVLARSREGRVFALRFASIARVGMLVARPRALQEPAAFVATTPGYEVLVQATGLGVLTDGSGKCNRDGGSSTLTLTMEVDADGQLPALAVSGSFVFRLD
jgi:hypothetical protein